MTLLLLPILTAFIAGCSRGNSDSTLRLLHVSYDPTREFFEAYNRIFTERWEKDRQQKVSVVQSHGGSGKQARAVIEGLKADVVSLALTFDIEQISKSGAVASDWQKRLPQESSPFYSTIVFLVRRGNPGNLKDWPDLSKAGIEIIMPNPKTSGGARWNYLAAWASALERNGKSEERARASMTSLLKNVPVFDSGARGAATTFVERELGDVLVTWENDAWLIVNSDKGADYQIVYPSISVRAEPVVSVVDRTVDKRGTRGLAMAYLEGLYRPESQQLLVNYHFRSIDDQIMKAQERKFPALKLVSIREYGGWTDFQRKHFSDGGVFDQLLGGK